MGWGFRQQAPATGGSMSIQSLAWDDEPAMFDPAAFRLERKEAELIERARRFGQSARAPRAARHDRDATFPTESFHDMHPEGLLAICVPEADGGLGASYRTYCLAAAELGRYCGATALSWNMHVCSTLWTGALADELMMTVEERAEHNERRRLHYKRIVGDGAVYSQPFSEGGAAAAGTVAFGTEARPVEGGFRVSGKKIFASLSGAADFYGILCTERGQGEHASRRNTLYLAIPAGAEGVSVVGDWDPLGMRATVSRTLLLNDVFVPEDEMLMPRGVYFRAATSWPHMFLTLSPTYMGLGQAAYDFTVRYLRGELPGTPPVKRRMYPTKQIAVADMRVTLEQTKALWFQAISEARANPTKEQVLRAYAAQYTVMENANALAAKAIRTCGGQAMLKNLSLERIYRDSRCGSLMLPWTAEICLDRIGRESLYEAGETDA
jgi:alkylation response protein AidB-like acyl-CoA dehydrogenase